jgi:hypothetical protein
MNLIRQHSLYRNEKYKQQIDKVYDKQSKTLEQQKRQTALAELENRRQKAIREVKDYWNSKPSIGKSLEELLAKG